MTTDALNEIREDSAVIQLVSFYIGKEEYAVEILRVQEILRLPDMTRVPKAPPFVKGVINLRGKIVPVVDLRARMGMEERPATQDSRIVVVNEQGRIVGLVVDAMSEVLRISESTIQGPPGSGQGRPSGDHIRGVAKIRDRLLILLDLERLLSDRE